MTKPNTFSERKKRVPSDFDRVAHRYDLLSTFNPGYQKHLRISGKRLRVRRGGRVLDLCCGTGSSTAALHRAHPTAQIVAVDGSSAMLEIARQKNELRGAEFIHGDAMDLEGAGVVGPFDAVFMAYGIRNMSDPDRCLEQIHRLLVPGGMALFHEYSVRDSRVSKAVWNTVAGTVIIPLGTALTGDANLFRYLRRSVNEFDGVRDFQQRLRRAGFVSVACQPMNGWQRGIVHTFVGIKGQK